jgi:hypothetical protein
MKMKLLCLTLGLLPAFAAAQSVGPVAGEREILLSGAGSSDRRFNSGSIGISGDYGWYRTSQTLYGIRQSVNYATIRGASLRDDFWNGSTRGFMNWHLSDAAFRPFVGASLGAVYGNGVRDSGFAGLELGFKHYVNPKTFVAARGEYQWFFQRSRQINDTFRSGAWAYTLGVGYNF